jgi:hypothetical protein
MQSPALLLWGLDALAAQVGCLELAARAGARVSRQSRQQLACLTRTLARCIAASRAFPYDPVHDPPALLARLLSLLRVPPPGRSPLIADPFALFVRWLILQRPARHDPHEARLKLRLLYLAALLQALLVLALRAGTPAAPPQPAVTSAADGFGSLQEALAYVRWLLARTGGIGGSGVGAAAGETAAAAAAASAAGDEGGAVELEAVARCVLPFVRKAALLLAAVEEGAAAPAAAASLSLSGGGASGVEELEALRGWLELPRPDEALLLLTRGGGGREAARLLEGWLEALLPLGAAQAAGLAYGCPLEPRPLQLFRLPALFQDLFHRYLEATCPRCGRVPDQPALCLLVQDHCRFLFLLLLLLLLLPSSPPVKCTDRYGAVRGATVRGQRLLPRGRGLGIRRGLPARGPVQRGLGRLPLHQAVLRASRQGEAQRLLGLLLPGRSRRGGTVRRVPFCFVVPDILGRISR